MTLRATCIPVGASMLIALTACNEPAGRSDTGAVLLTHTRERECSDPSFAASGQYRFIAAESRDQALKTAKDHAVRIMDLSNDFCILEKVDTKPPERCFFFFDRIPAPGGGGLICIRDERIISGTYLEE